MERFTTLVAAGILAGCVAAASDGSGGARAVVYLSPSADRLLNGIWTAEACGIPTADGTDFTPCCPAGFTPVGFTAGGDLACLEG